MPEWSRRTLMDWFKQAKTVDCNYRQISSKPVYKVITTSVAIDIEVGGKYCRIKCKSDKKVHIWELEVRMIFFRSFVRSSVCLFVCFEGVVERRSYETFEEKLTTLKNWMTLTLFATDTGRQGRNEVYGIRDHSAGIWDHKPWDRDQ